MRRIILGIFACASVALLMIGCGAPAGNNAPAGNGANNANKPANTAAAPAGDKSAAEADLKKLMTTAAEALAKNDADAMDKIYGDDYTLVDQNGKVQTRAERLAALRSGDVKYSSFGYSDISVRFNPEVTGAITIAKATFKATAAGKSIDGDYRVTGVWAKDKSGAWKQYSAQATRIEGGGEPAKTEEKKPEANANK